MADDTSQSSDRRGNRSRKAARVIEAKAVDVTPAVETSTVATPSEPVEPTPVSEAPTPPVEPVQTQAEPEKPTAPEPKTEAGSGPDIIPPPPLPPVSEKPRLALPMTAAGLIGALFGAGAGVIAPMMFGSAPQVDPVRIQRLEQGLGEIARRPAPAPANVAEIQALQQRIAGLEGELKRRLDGQDQKIAALPPTTASTAAPPPVDLAALTGRLDALDRALAALDQKAEGARAAVGEGLKAMEPRLAELTTGLGRTAQRVEATAAAPIYGAAQALHQAFQRGAPYALELGALEALGVKPEQLQALKAAADRGLPSAQQIAEAFRPLALQAARAGQPTVSGAQAFFESIVRSRATGPGAADTPEGQVSAIEKALAAGDVAGALATWAKLPEAARKATEAWAMTAQQREAAARAIRDIQDQALAALRKAAP